MDQWWNRPAPGEGWKLQIDPETGLVTEHWHEHIWLAPFRGLLDLCSDIRNDRMTTADWVFIVVVVWIMARGG